MLSWVLRDSRNIYLNETTHLGTISELISVKEGFKKKEKVKLALLAELGYGSERILGGDSIIFLKPSQSHVMCK